MIDKEYLLKERGSVCESCGTPGDVECHHIFAHRMKGRNDLNTRENLMLVCKKCHEHQNGYEARVGFWLVQCKRYGRKHMLEWWQTLSLKNKDNFE